MRYLRRFDQRSHGCKSLFIMPSNLHWKT